VRRALLSLVAAAIILAAVLRTVLAPAPGAASDLPVATPTSMDLYGASLGFWLRPGDVVSVHSAAGVLCGRCVVTNPGVYGLLHVYGDDPTTPRLDGAAPGERLEIEVNGQRVQAAGGEPVWTRDGERIRVNVAR
jgi:hypothetical protein